MTLANLSLRLRVFLFFAALAAGNIGALVAGMVFGFEKLGVPEALDGFIIGGTVAGFVILGLITGVWFLFDENVAKPIERLAGGMRARTHAEVASELDQSSGRYLGDLAPAAAAVTQHLAETRSALIESVQRETNRLAREKERLEALLSDVPVGVLLCTPDHQLVFYNGQAVDLLGGGHAPGLDRRVFDYLHQAPVAHAYARLIETDDPDAASDLLCSTVADGKVLAARMRLLSEGEDRHITSRPGYVLTLRDVSGDMRAHAQREQLMDELFDRIRRPAAALQSLTGVLTADDGPSGAARDKVRSAARTEALMLADAIHTLFERHEANRADWWPLGMIRASDLGDAVRARVEADHGQIEIEAAPLMLRCEGFEMVALLGTLTSRLEGRSAFRLEISEEEGGALIALEWHGAPVPISELEQWLDAPLEVGMADVTGRRVLVTHASEIWPEPMAGGRGRLCIPLREARRVTKRPKPIPRAVVYDFELLGQVRDAEVAATPLERLTYVVFDTETTGLLPTEGDEIVQIAAVRIVNGRRVETEVFDTLVNPHRSIPPASTEVHGISDAMVVDAPDIVEVGRRFHKFAEGAVLIAHNAPFDMEFLRRKELSIGEHFDNPILDTVLLSAVVFGQSETHSLDALTHRLGITIPEEARHTAIGDTVATADAFLKLLPALKARGLNTFGEVVAEVRKHGRLLKDLNA
ncbi:exonuclease domain-containing protein [Sedimentimonas flavescens]|uniref:DNA-directed DNA polymerase n=1 Tax=Sedimentimonas flavescens TaxID=2851012 RepID=A0ABT2ZWH0_9RHOB|nr:exonuclease domain-containing protein [Sedimentimonas flavescens]MBW0159085.1 DNA polymerase III subunit epsilon [Sedimentimonas flavescens]MCV2878093.1 exonuclease domain-containing protein [Sedimentimonas flavescens]